MIIIYNTHIIGLSTSYANIWSAESGADSHIEQLWSSRKDISANANQKINKTLAWQTV